MLDFDITSDNWINVLNDADKLDKLAAILHNAPFGKELVKLVDEVDLLARTCIATGEQLDATVRILVAKGEPYRGFVNDLVSHPELPLSTAMYLLDQDVAVGELAHRRGPQELLEVIAERFEISEAITTLVLRYYNQSTYTTEEFVAFVKAHANNYMMKWNIEHATKAIPEEKRMAAIMALRELGYH